VTTWSRNGRDAPGCSSRSAILFDRVESEGGTHHSGRGQSESARRPGRTQKIASDETPLNAANPDIDARIGWLLAISRLRHVVEASRTVGTSQRRSRTRASWPVAACSVAGSRETPIS
jgi:hypothetical protein